MIAIDRPNTFIVSRTLGRSRIFMPFRYKQDDVSQEWPWYPNNFDTRHESSFDFRHQFRNTAFML